MAHRMQVPPFGKDDEMEVPHHGKEFICSIYLGIISNENTSACYGPLEEIILHSLPLHPTDTNQSNAQSSRP
jgi:hypothetical protein